MPSLFDPITIGDLQFPNRIIMAPLTRCRTEDDRRIPNEMMAEYYAQRASAGFILTEATAVTPMGVGYPNTPGIWSPEQIAGWKLTTKAVHDKGGKILLQLWHVGRISDPFYLKGELPVAPSAIAAPGHVSLMRPKKEFVTPRALLIDEIPAVIAAYKQGAINAKLAGFDGVEIHGANGYLLDQFLQDGSNKRSDRYGGSIENRARLMLEVVDAVVDVWGKGKVGLHIAPRGDSNGVSDSNHVATFSYLASALKNRIAFICAREHPGVESIGAQLKKLFGGVYIANEAFDQSKAEEVVANGQFDAVAFGKLFIANPDLPKRFAEHAALNAPDPNTFYASGPAGYIDYAFMENANRQ